MARKHGVKVHEIKEVQKSVDIKVLKCIRNKKLSIHYIALDKRTVPYQLHNKQNMIQQHLIGQLISEIVGNLDENQKLHLIIDKFLPESKVELFDSYINQKISGNQIEIKHETSHSNNGLQAAHVVVKGINKFYRDKNSEYFNIIKDKITININSGNQR